MVGKNPNISTDTIRMTDQTGCFTTSHKISEITANIKNITSDLVISFSPYRKDKINININNEPAAGQIIFHTHLHVIPRYAADGFKLWHGRRGYEEGEKDEVAKKIIRAL